MTDDELSAGETQIDAALKQAIRATLSDWTQAEANNLRPLHRVPIIGPPLARWLFSYRLNRFKDQLTEPLIEAATDASMELYERQHFGDQQ